jgi:segregation and condensation protein B
MTDEDRAPISWEALAAELDATRQEAEERGDADPGTWDAVAAELATRVAERPPEPQEPPPVVVPEQHVPEQHIPEQHIPDEPAEPAAGAAEEEAAAEQLEHLDAGTLRGRLEALLFVMDDPVDLPTLAAALRCPAEQVGQGLVALGEEYDRRGAGITLRQVGEGWRLYTREDHAEVVERWLADGSRTRLSQAALETLAVIAYRQPVTRARVSAIRGVGVDAVMRTLLARGLVQEVGSDPDSGGGLYATTPLFLERLGLRSLDELPELAPLVPDTAAVLDEHPDA